MNHLLYMFLCSVILFPFLFCMVVIVLPEMLGNLQKILNHCEYRHLFNTTDNSGLNKIILFLFIVISLVSFYFFWCKLAGKTFIIPSIISSYKAVLWMLTQFCYLFIGLIDCFGLSKARFMEIKIHHKQIHHKGDKTFVYKNENRLSSRKKSKEFYAQAHDIFYLTLLYVIFSLILFYIFLLRIDCYNKGKAITTAVEIAGTVIGASAIALHGKVSSVTSMLIVLSVFILMQFGLYGCLI